MRFAILSDIHSNYDALQAVSRQLHGQAVDQILCLGDVIGYGAEPQACINWLQQQHAIVVKGNHEAMLEQPSGLETSETEVHQVIRWTRSQLSPSQLNWLTSRPLRMVVAGICLTHSTPYQPEWFEYVSGPIAAERAFVAFSEPLALIGHTHVPALAVENQTGQVIWKKIPAKLRINESGRMLINPGSVGQPRDGCPQARWGLLDLDKQSYQSFATDYSVASAAKKIIQAELPARFANRLMSGR